MTAREREELLQTLKARFEKNRQRHPKIDWNPPKGSAVEMAQTMNVNLLTEEQYRELQMLGEFDLKTSSWIETPPELRELGGALFCDRRYGYASRGFRGALRA